MTTIKKSSATSRKSGARVNSRTNKVQSSNINTSAVDVSDILPSGSVDVQTIQGESGLQSGSVSVPAAVGLSDGSMTINGGALSSPAVGGGVRSSKGRNNSADQTDLALSLDAKETEEQEQNP